MLLVLARLRGRETEAAGVEAAAGQRRRKLGIRRGRGERSDAVFHADRKRPGRRQAVGSAEGGRHGDAGSDQRHQSQDPKSVVWGKSGSVRVDRGGRRSIKKKSN